MSLRAAKHHRRVVGCAEGIAGRELSYPSGTTTRCRNLDTRLPERWDLHNPALAAWCTEGAATLSQRPTFIHRA